jgi:transcriptional regulator with XRE-family HTH domain
MTSQSPFAARLAQLLEAKDIRPGTLSRRLGRSPTYVRDLLQGRAGAPRADMLPALASALGTTVEDLLGGPPATPTPGMAECAVAPLDRRDPAQGMQPFAAAVAALVDGAPGRTAWTLRRALPGFRLSVGDVLVVQIGPDAASGDLVLATSADPATGAAQTSVRQLLPPYLLPADPIEGRALLLDHDRHAIMGRIAAVLRDCDARPS